MVPYITCDTLRGASRVTGSSHLSFENERARTGLEIEILEQGRRGDEGGRHRGLGAVQAGDLLVEDDRKEIQFA